MVPVLLIFVGAFPPTRIPTAPTPDTEIEFALLIVAPEVPPST